MKLTLSDLMPEEAVFSLSSQPGKTYVLGKVTLRVRIWLNKNFKQDEIEQIFSDQKLGEISQIAYFLLKDKEEFKTLEDFQEAFVTQKDFESLLKAMLTTIGISEPILKKITEEAQAEGNAASLSPPTGAESTI